MSDTSEMMVTAFSDGITSVFSIPAVRWIFVLVLCLFLARILVKVISFFRGGGGHG